MPLSRVLEPEVMDTREEAREYDAMDHRDVNAVFCTDLLEAIRTRHREDAVAETLDVGTGTALIAIELCRRAPNAHILGVDLAHSMLDIARRNIERAALGGVVDVLLADAKALEFADGAFRCVMSNSLLHHVPAPAAALGEMLRVLLPGGLLFVRDLVRPGDDAAIGALVARYAANAPPLQRSLFEASLRASLTRDELRSLLAPLGVPAECVQTTSDRHVTIAYWKPEVAP